MKGNRSQSGLWVKWADDLTQSAIFLVIVLLSTAIIGGCEQFTPATAYTTPVIPAPPASTTQPASPSLPVSSTLPVPHARPVGGTVAYGTVVRLSVDSLPAGTVLEFSTDDGLHWQAGDSLAMQTSLTLRVRSRRDLFVSTAGAVPFRVSFKRVLLVGNSITTRAADPSIGWLGNWGMAASAPANDYVHKLTERLKGLDPEVDVRIYDGVAFEQQFWAFDYSRTRSAAAFRPDLIVMRIAENAPAALVGSHNFKQYYQQLIDSLRVNYSPVKIVLTTSFFDQPATSSIIRQVAAERNYFLADFNGLVNNRSFQAYDKFANSGVGAHPGDAGMQAITDIIWDKVR